jgi:UDP-glucuronate 4-epimerase
MNFLITGAAGFIGYNLSKHLLTKYNSKIFGIDNLNNNSNQKKIKEERLKELYQLKKNFYFSNIDITKKNILRNYFKKNKFSVIIHLAAEAGVRNSYNNPEVFFDSNVNGFFNILNFSKEFKIKHLIYASSSSVYGNSKVFPQNEEINTDYPESMYAATKKTNEILAFAYSNNFKIKCTGLRFFTVYGPFGREDMALYKFTNSIINNQKVNLFNNGRHYRDFTYVDDTVDAITRVIYDKKKRKNMHEVYNVGKGKSNNLKIYIKYISKLLNKKAKINNVSFQKGDVYKTLSDIKKINNDYNYIPKTNLITGLKKYIKWFKAYY